ncbi:MAG: HD domain-containing protein [Aquificae bacterium]|nr:HD domain-containing protein [Aquificota bacterium]
MQNNSEKVVSSFVDIAEKLFRLAVIERWNDHPRPFNITELDKQAHKAMVAFLFARIEEEEGGKKIDWSGLIDGLIFEALQRSVLTDLKPRLLHNLLKTRKKELLNYIYNQFEDTLKAIDKTLFERFKLYFEDPEYLKLEKRVIEAAHFIPTYWEFQFIYPVAKAMYRIEQLKKDIEDSLEEFHTLLGVHRFLLKKKLYGFINLCGQLRFQKRWSSVVIVPRLSVMGHLFVVATFSYFLMRYVWWWEDIKLSPKAFYATFFTALFHDLAEIITRDIISSLKNILGREEIRRIEVEGLEKEVISLLPRYIAEHLRCFLSTSGDLNIDEFTNRICKGVEIKTFSPEDTKFLVEKQGLPVWGQLVKFADYLSAYTEASHSIGHGTSNKELIKAVKNTREKLLNHPIGKIIPFTEKLLEELR